MLNAKTELDDSKLVINSHSLRMNVNIDYFIEKDILVNGEVKTKEEIEEENKKESKKSKNKSKTSKHNKSISRSSKTSKTSDKKKKKVDKYEDDSSYYFSYTIAGKIEGETDVVQYSNSTYSTFHDIDVNIDFLKNFYDKQVEIKIWKLIPNNENKSISDEYIYKQIRTKRLINSRKSSFLQNQFKSSMNRPTTNSFLSNSIKENKNEDNIVEMNDDISNQSSLVNYNFSLIPIKPVYDSLQQLNIQFSNIRSSFSIPNSKIRNINNNIKLSNNNEQLKNNKHLNRQYNINNFYGINDMFGNNNINFFTGDYINEFNNTVHIRPHPHHFLIPEKASRFFGSNTKPESHKRSSSKSQTRNGKKGNNNSNKNKSSKYKDSDDEYYSDSDYDSDLDTYKGKNSKMNKKKKEKKDKKYKKDKKDNKDNKEKTQNNKYKRSSKYLTGKNKINEKGTGKEKGKLKGKNKDKSSNKKNDDQYELIWKSTFDIYKLFFDDIEIEKTLEYPLGEIKHFGFKLTLSEPLLSSNQRKFLNPIAIEIVSAKSMPPKPCTTNINYAMVAPTYCKFSFFDSEKEYKCYEEHRQENNKIIFNSVHLLLSGHIKEEELFDILLYKKLNIEIHDRDYEVPKEKKYISNKFDYIDSYRTTYIPNVIYGVASYSLAPLVTGVKELTLISPVETNFHHKDKGSDFVNTVNYIEYGTSLKIKVSLAYPIIKNIITNINEITNFDFSRIIIIADKSENQNIIKLIRIINEFNIKEFFKFELKQSKKNELNENKPGKKDGDNSKSKNKSDNDKTKSYTNKKISKINKDIEDDKIQSINSIYDSFNNNKTSNNSIDFIENFDIEAFRIDKNLLDDPELGIITGFHIYDQEQHIIFLEGPIKILQNIRDILNSNDFIKFKTFHSPKLTFYKRIWSSSYIAPIYINLNNSIKSLLNLNNTFLKCHTPKISLETIKLLNMIIECNSMEEVNSKLLFPSYEQLSSLIGYLGNNVTAYEILLQLNTLKEQCIPSFYTPNIVEESVVLPQKKEKINNYKRVDNMNYLYMELIKKKLNREPNYVRQNIDKFHGLPSHQRERVYGNEGIPYNYSIQYLNSSELKKKMLQEEYSKYIKILIHSYNKKYNSQNFEIYNSNS
ncbi:hypothetical protein BCR32DRAFT_266437 [Anaeromyces robustus]|uniref:Uncharacterized protein n=1 Tax=Anaeromyces robustus TaxID=1754192 RepID=A0A1Y1XEL8_9FUNG|nr:hypothetical protein BCR32DRAFT_266437 [Anaeromyces robustus]|eukprot:ORX84221.1 hypothetical protein BCR32DRAFT_266437 [Anaeromyces robustus]